MRKIALTVLVSLIVAGFALTTCYAASAKDDARAMVKKTAAFLKTAGKERTLAEISNPKGQFVKGELYIFAIDMNGVTLAHGANPKLVGKNMLDLKDPDGKFFIREFISTAKKGSGWVDYKWTNPVSKKIEEKTSYIESAGDFLLAAGVYK